MEEKLNKTIVDGSATNVENDTQKLDYTGGQFYKIMAQSSKEIKQYKIAAITEGLNFAYKARIEEIEREIRSKKWRLEEMMDLFPSTTQSLVIGKDFNPKEFVTEDLQIHVDLRNLEIMLDIAKRRYKFLTGLDI
jgi:hypothetical protein